MLVKDYLTNWYNALSEHLIEMGMLSQAAQPSSKSPLEEESKSEQ